MKPKIKNRINKWETISGWLFVMPAALLFATFTLYPIISVFYYSTTKWTGLSTPEFIGLANFQDILQSEAFYSIISNNFKFLFLGVPLWTFFPLIIATLIFQQVRGWRFFRSAFFFPTVLSVVVTGSLFRSLFQYQGVFNIILRNIGLGFLAKDWWGSGATAIPMLTVIINWVGFGSSMLIYLAGMSNISESVIEASLLDGANWWQRFRHVYLPELKRLIQLNVVLNIMYSFTSLFGYIYTITKGGPGYETTVIEYLIYLKAFTSREMGYASALSVLLGILVACISVIQFVVLRKKEKT